MAEPKATKKEFLEFMEERELITAHNLVNQFGYSYSYACKKLSLLKKQGLVQDMGSTPTSYRGQWYLTNKGYRRLYFLQQREKEQKAVVKKEEMREKEEVLRLKKRVEELEELVKVLTRPGGIKGEVSRLLREYVKLTAAYKRALKLGLKPQQLDLSGLTSRLEKLQRYSKLLPAEERKKLIKRPEMW
jgi:ribosomal protein S25